MQRDREKLPELDAVPREDEVARGLVACFCGYRLQQLHRHQPAVPLGARQHRGLPLGVGQQTLRPLNMLPMADLGELRDPVLAVPAV